MTASEVKLSPEFKIQTTKSIIAIILFFITYIILLAGALALTVACIYWGVMFMALHPSFITLALGAGICSLGLLVFIFLIKFIGSTNKADLSHLTQIKKEDAPELFEAIEEIVHEVGTKFPKKVFLSPEVNASVFYNSSFWSMILPVRKNLMIGMGLINTVTKSELKAILAHEFGHFSQKTMKVGSYVYNVNQVIFNLLNNNNSFESMVSAWASISNFITIFVQIAVFIIQGIQGLLRLLYGVVNKSYMSLSREMEFHADEIASTVTGYEPLKSSLLRMELAQYSFQQVLGIYEAKIETNEKSTNLFKEQSFVMKLQAENREIPFENNLPVITFEELNKFNKSKLVIKDQWASHPSTEERIEKLEEKNNKARNFENQSADSLFNNVDDVQKDLTAKMFADVEYKGEVQLLSYQAFVDHYKDELEKNTFSLDYNSYYDNKNPLEFDIDAAAIGSDKEMKDLFSNEKVDLVYEAFALESDIEVLVQIVSKTIPVKTFDYDGVKYRRKQTSDLVVKLRKDLDALKEKIKENDKEIFSFFKGIEDKQGKPPKLSVMYREFFEYDKNFDPKYKLYEKISEELQFLQFNTPFEVIKSNFRSVKKIEDEIKIVIQGLLKDDRLKEELTEEIKASFEKYLEKDWVYFGAQIYYDECLEVMYKAINNYAFILSKSYFLFKKSLLNYQLSLASESGN